MEAAVSFFVKGGIRMNYVMADIHGCFREYMQLMEKLALREEDTLFVLGDAMDRGEEPIRVIQDLMERQNVIYILGNHDAMMLGALKPLMEEITEESVASLDADVLLAFRVWIEKHGANTFEQFRKLPRPVQQDILFYLAEASLYETVEHGGSLYVLVHAGLSNFDAKRELSDYEAEELIWERPDYGKNYFPGSRIFLVTGHTPTPMIRRDGKPLIYAENGHIAIDCGCVFGGCLAAYCIETGEAYYVEREAEQEPLD